MWDDEGTQSFDMDIIFLKSDELQKISAVNIHLLNEMLENTFYEPMRTMRILPAPPPTRFVRSHSLKQHKKVCPRVPRA